MGQFIQTWAGECSAWECDDLGHLNMRHYMTKTRQARQMLIIRLGLDEAFKSDTISSIRMDWFHIKYMGEARPGDPLRIESAVLTLGKSTARLCHMMFHVDGRLACSVVETIEHISLRTRLPFPWPKRAHANAKAFTLAEQPAPSKPRGFKYDDHWPAPDEISLKGWGVRHIGSGVFQPHEMGPTDRAGAQALLGRTTETIGHINEAWPEMHDKAYRDAGGSGALLEAHIVMGRPVETGDAYHFYSGIHSADQYTRRLVHNMVDVVTGENIFSMTGIGCLFNLKTRKLVKATPEQVQALSDKSIPAFSE